LSVSAKLNCEWLPGCFYAVDSDIKLLRFSDWLLLFCYVVSRKFWLVARSCQAVVLLQWMVVRVLLCGC